MYSLSPFKLRPILIGLVLICAFFSPGKVSAQRVALKTNALEYMILSPNLTVEARISRKISLQLGLATNPINKPIGDYKLTNLRVEPEVRYWFNRPMARHFVALSATAGTFSIQWRERYLVGDAVAAGVSYGYALVLSRHWNMEAEIGLGFVSLYGYNYRGEGNRPAKENLDRLMPVPVRAALSFSYIFK